MIEIQACERCRKRFCIYQYFLTYKMLQAKALSSKKELKNFDRTEILNKIDVKEIDY